ncbi:MAG: DNA polymerase I, partial [Gemmatimonadaceae bacterium]
MRLPESPRLFLVDGYALIYRAFFALISRPLTTSRGENTSAAWGIVNFVERLRSTHHPEYLGWVHDSGLSFRHERYPAYKATRQKLTDELQADFDRGMERICDILAAYNIPVLSLQGYEADDVIGTLARQGTEQGMQVVVVSGDKDFQQLVRPGVWLLNPGRGGPAGVEEQWVGEENGAERLGVPPSRVTDYLALVGDSSDNIPGVPGIGDKTARQLVTTYDSLETILERAGELTGKRPREALLAYPDRARLSKELVTIREDLPVALELPALAAREPDHARLKDILVELEFHTLAKDHASVAAAPEKRATQYSTVGTIDEMLRVVDRARGARHIAIDTETLMDGPNPLKVDPLRSTLVAMSIAVGPGEAFYFPFRHREVSSAQGSLLMDASGDRTLTDAPEDRGLSQASDTAFQALPPVKPAAKKRVVASSSIAATYLAANRQSVANLPPLLAPEMAPLRHLLEDAGVRKTVQHAKYDLLALRRAGIEMRGVDFDTMLASYVLDPGRRSHGLDVLALEFLDYKVTTVEELCGKGKGAIPFDECPIECAREYSCEDADMTWQLREIFEPQLESQRLTQLLNDIEIPLIHVLAEMEQTGISIDVPWFASLKDRFQREREAVEKKIYDVAGQEFNINSNQQLREILFEKLKLPVLKRTSTGASTDASVLQELAENGEILPGLLLEYRELSKLENTYLDTLPALLNPDTRRLHTSFNQTVASTGRLSSSDPNLQNIPIRRELGRDIRRGFIPRKGWTLVSADYSQIELRLLAHLSNDESFVAAFRAGGDIHRQTASIIFDVDVDAVTSDMRARAKTINFATIYGQGAHALSRQ